jgi:hypothetical protein
MEGGDRTSWGTDSVRHLAIGLSTRETSTASGSHWKENYTALYDAQCPYHDLGTLQHE